MAPQASSSQGSGIRPQAELDTISNRIQIALAKRDELVKAWTSSSAHLRQSEEEIEAEDSLLFRPEPAYLGVGCAVPEGFLANEADRSKKVLRAKFGKGLQASKRRDAEEKAESAKRGLAVDESDEEEGRTGLGRKKKIRSAVGAQVGGNTRTEAKPKQMLEQNSEDKLEQKLEKNIENDPGQVVVPQLEAKTEVAAKIQDVTKETQSTGAEGLPIRSKKDRDRERKREKKRRKREAAKSEQS